MTRAVAPRRRDQFLALSWLLGYFILIGRQYF